MYVGLISVSVVDLVVAGLVVCEFVCRLWCTGVMVLFDCLSDCLCCCGVSVLTVLPGCVIVCRFVRDGLRCSVNSVGMFSCYLIFICVVALVTCFASMFPDVMVCD